MMDEQQKWHFVALQEAERLRGNNAMMLAALMECRKLALAGYWAAKSAPEEAKFAAIDAAAKAVLEPASATL